MLPCAAATAISNTMSPWIFLGPRRHLVILFPDKVTIRKREPSRFCKAETVHVSRRSLQHCSGQLKNMTQQLFPAFFQLLPGAAAGEAAAACVGA